MRGNYFAWWSNVVKNEMQHWGYRKCGEVGRNDRQDGF